MASGNPAQARVRHALLKGKKIPECLSTLDNTCAAGKQCPEVQGSQSAAMALGALQTAVTNAHTSLTNKQSLAQALMAAAKALRLDFTTVKLTLAAYEAAVSAVAVGDASVINKAGLLSQGTKTPTSALTKVSVVRSKVGKHPMEAHVSWPAAPGASAYVLAVNPTPQNPTGTWIELGTGASRRRLVKAAAVSAQLLARVAAVSGDGTRSEWSDEILVTTL